MGSDNGAKKGKLGKLTQLENEIAKLSEQLHENKQTISLLKQTLTERDLRIHELEAKLNYAQDSLLSKVNLTINQCKQQLKKDLGLKIIDPALSQIQQQIEVISGIVIEAKDFINKATNSVHQCPDLAIKYFEVAVVEPSRLLVGTLDSKVRTGRELALQKVIYPGKLWYEKIFIVAQALPTEGLVIYQVWLAEPIMQKIGALPTVKKELCNNAEFLAINLLGQLKAAIEQALANTAEAIKKSPFWDGKRTVVASL